MLTVTEVAEKLHKTPQWIRKLIRSGKIKAEKRTKVTHYWLIEESELERLQEKDEK